jgi:hypothetical protein
MSTILKANFQWNGQGDLLRRCNLEKGGKVQQVIDKAVIDYDLQYVPMQTGTLGKSAYMATQIGSGRVVYSGPYARYLYYGEVMGPNIPVFEDDTGEPTRFFSPPGQKKHLTGRSLQYSKEVNPLAGSFWFERMKADHAQDILREAIDATKN